MAAKYGDTPNVIFEICNEPNGTDWSDIKRFADLVIPRIRATRAAIPPLPRFVATR